MKKFTILAVLSFTLIIAGCKIDQSSLGSESFTFEWSDGNCKTSSECRAIEFGCGGGHIICTNNTEKWKGMMSTCDVVENHPLQRGFRCSCVSKENRCGWVK